MKALLLLICLIPPLHADWQSAREAFDTGAFEQAYQLFARERTDAASSPALEFNLGNAAFRMGDPALAVLHYRRALWMRPGDPDVPANLERVTDLLGAEIPPLPWPRRLTGFMPAKAWKALWVSGLWLCALLLLAGQRINAVRNAQAWCAPLLTLTLAVIAFGVWGSSSAPASREGVLSGAGEVVARFEPLESSTRHFALPAGSVVTIEDQSRSWTRIRFGDNSGWIPAAQVLRL